MKAKTRSKQMRHTKSMRLTKKGILQRAKWKRHRDSIRHKLHALKTSNEVIYNSAFEEWSQQVSEYWDGDWVIEDFVDRMRGYGIDVDIADVQYSGFWSQGDGASFSAAVTTNTHFFDASPELYEDWSVLSAIGPHLADIYITRSNGLGSHSYMMQLANSDWMNETDAEQWEDNKKACVRDGIYKGLNIYNTLKEFTEEQMDEFSELVLDICRGFADELYAELESAYEYETGRECFDEHLRNYGWEINDGELELM